MAKAPGPQDSSGESQPDPAPTGFKLGSLKLGGGFKLSVPGPAVTPAPDPSPNPPTDSVVAEPQPDSAGVSEAPVGLTLQGLAGLDTGSVVGIPGIEGTEIDPSESEGYLDQVPATAPVRDLPTELDKQQKAFIDSLDSIYRLHDDPEMFVNMVRRIMSEMQERPELCELLAASKGQDSNAIIRGLRQSAGMAQVKKVESKAKRTGGKAKPQSAQVDSVMQTLQGLAGFDGSFD